MPPLIASVASQSHGALRLGSGGGADVSLLPHGYEGGSVTAPVVATQSGGEHFARKHLGPRKYDDLTFEVGFAVSDQVFSWIAGSWGPTPAKKSGAMLTLDYNFNLKGERAFAGALIAETTIPALDATSKDAGLLALRLQAEATSFAEGSGKLPLVSIKQKVWRTSNFRLQIGGLDCTKVTRIESFVVRRQVETASSGSGEISLLAGSAQFPNLVITLAEASAQSWHNWHRSFVVDGEDGDSFEKHGSIQFLAPNGSELSRIELHNLGIIRIARSNVSGAGTLNRVTAELYCERMELLRPGIAP